MSKVTSSMVSKRNRFSMKFFGVLVMMVGLSVSVWGQYTVNFEGSSETKTAYTSASVTLSSISWNMTDALIGTAANDRKLGNRSARIQASGTMTMLADKTTGAGTISLKFANYGTDTGNSFKVEYSTNSGVIWTQIGNTTAVSSTSLNDFSADLNVTGNIRIKITKTAGTNRLNIDDIVITDYPILTAVTSSAATSISATSATLNGNVTSDGGATISERGFVYKTSAGATINDNKTTVSGTTGTFTLTPTLSINTRYYFKAYAINTVGTTLSSPELDFWTLANVPSAPTVSNATPNTLDVAVNANSNPSTTEFAIQETGGNQYLQADGTLGGAAVWQTASVWGTKTVTGLSSETSYGFQVKARNGANAETAFGSSASLSTSIASSPLLTVGAISGFGAVCVNNTTGASSFTITGLSLTTDNVTIGALDGYSYSVDWGGPFTSTLSLSQPGGSYSKTIHVKFTPTASQSYNGNIVVGGGGASNVNRSVTGTGVNSSPTVTTTNPASSVTSTTVTLSGNVGEVGCQSITARGICYGTSASPDINGTKSTETGGLGAFSSNITNLSPNTLYYFRAYATSSAGTSYGTEYSFTTSAIGTPTAVTATDVNAISFTANWNAVSGASEYKLDVTESTRTLFISEYIEGSGTTEKYIEIYNGTGTTVNLSDYKLQLYSNGSSTVSNEATLSGMLENGSTIVYKNSSSSLYSGNATVLSSVVNFNGDDAVALYKISNSSYVDIIGRIGNDPGTAWTSTSNSTADKTLVRKPTVMAGITSNPSGTGSTAFTTLESEWTQYDIDVISNLGSHSQSNISGYNNLSVSGTSHSVTGLAPNKTYYYKVRAASTNSTSANSNVITVTTDKGATTITATGSTIFTYTGSPQGPGTATVSGSAGSVTYIYSGTGATSYTSSATKPINVGTYQVIATVAAAGDYYGSSSSPLAFTITKAETTITATGSTSYNYSGLEQGPSTSTVSGSAGAVSYTYTGTGATSYSASATKPINAGTYQVVATVAADNNYNTASSSALAFTISPVALTITGITANDKNYDGTTDATLDGTPAYSGLVNSESYSVSGTASAVFANANVGSNKVVTVSGYAAPTANYSVTQPAGLTANITSLTTSISSSGNIGNSALLAGTALTVQTGVELTVNQNSSVHSITVQVGGKLTLEAGNSLTTSGITLQTSSTGNATFVDKRTDETPSAISGTVLQYMPQGRNWYVTSPVADAQTSALTAVGLGSSVSYWNEAGSAWVNSYSGALTRGVGYIAVSNAGSGTNNVSFSGNFYSGPVPVALTRKGTSSIGYNLIANPYPSYLNAMEAINANANVQKTIWYRTRSTGTTPLYKFETVNTTSGEGTDAAGTGTVTGYVPPMQAFWVRTLTDNNSITFTNAMRYHGLPYVHDNTIPTTPLKAPGNTQAANKLVRLQVAKGNSTDETVVYFNPNAAVGFDDYDSPKWSNASAAIPELYTIASNEMLAINGLPEIVYNTELPLGFYAGAASVYSIKAKELRNIDSSTRVILKDGSIEYDLTNGDSYQFNSAVVNDANRFSLIFRTAGVATEVKATELDNKTSVFVNANGELIVNTAAPIKSDAKVSVYNAIGQQICIQPLYSSSTIATAAKTAGVYWVKISNGDDVITRKIVIK